MRLLKTILLLIILTSINSIVCSQTISGGDSLCFSLEQSKKIMSDLKRGEICDSISNVLSLQIANFEEVIKKSDEQIIIQQKQINKQNIQIKLMKRVIPISIVGGGIVGWIISK